MHVALHGFQRAIGERLFTYAHAARSSTQMVPTVFVRHRFGAKKLFGRGLRFGAKNLIGHELSVGEKKLIGRGLRVGEKNLFGLGHKA